MSLPPPDPGSVVAVTGASSGIGAALAAELASRGHDLLLAARRGHRLDRLAERLGTRFGVSTSTVACDLARPDGIDALAERLAAGPAHPSGLCNNAGTAIFGRFQDLPRERDERLVHLNAIAVHRLTAAVLPRMLERGAGAILNVGSVGGFQPMPGNSTYSASKAFVNCFSEALHVDLRGTGVSCSLLCPGLVQTELHARAGVPQLSGSGPGFAWTPAARVAAQGVDAMVEGKRRVTPGLYAKVSALSGQHAPRPLVLRAIQRAAERVGRANDPKTTLPASTTDAVVPPEL
jgi:uncharacterized protein